MATAATVTIRLDADSATLVRELSKAEQSTQASFAKMRAEAASLATGFGVIAGAAGVALIALTKSSFESIDALAKVADRLGVTTEAMRTMQVAADLAGVNQENLTNALQKQQQVLFNASRGLGRATDAFSQLGVSYQDIMALPVDQQFGAISEALNKIDNVTRRNAVAMTIWGTSANEMINFAADAGISMTDLDHILEDLNVRMDRLDSAKVEQANDALYMAKLSAEGLGNSIAVAVAPVVQGLAEQFLDSARAANGFQDTVASAMETAAKVVGHVANGILGIKIAFQTVAGVGMIALGTVVSALASLNQGINTLFVQPILRGLEYIANAAKVLGEALGLDGLADKAYAVEMGIDGMAKAMQNAADAAQDVGANMIGAGQSIFDDISASLNQKLPSTAVDEWFAEVKAKSEAAAAATADAIDERNRRAMEAAAAAAAAARAGIAGGSGLPGKQSTDPLATVTGPAIEAPPNPFMNPDLVRQTTDLATQQYLESWALANQMRIEADQAVKDTLFQSDQEAGQFLIQLAAQQAREKVIAEFEARGEALDETGQPRDAAARADFEQAVYDETLSREANFLNQRLQLQGRFGQQYIGYQNTISKLFGKQWADTHEKTLQGMAGFASAAGAIGQQLFAGNKAFGIANAIVNTYVGVTQALSSMPFPANLAAAATVLASGFAQVKSIQSTNVGAGGVSGAVGSAPSISAGTDVADLAGPSNKEIQQDRQKSVQVIFQGDVIGWDEHIQSRVIAGIREAVDDRDVILISSGSRNALELVGP